MIIILSFSAKSSSVNIEPPIINNEPSRSLLKEGPSNIEDLLANARKNQKKMNRSSRRPKPDVVEPVDVDDDSSSYDVDNSSISSDIIPSRGSQSEAPTKGMNGEKSR